MTENHSRKMFRQNMPQSQSTQNQSLNPLESLLKGLSNITPEDTNLIKKAYAFAEKAHAGHTRHSGEPYLNHLVETAKILSELGAGGITISAGLLHDTIEDTGTKREEIAQEFGEEIAFLVEGVTKLGHLKYKGADRHNESLRKLFVAMSEDIRVLLIKLADRLHNMRTLSHVPKEKQLRIAQETLEIYAPIAYRLGIRKINRELEDLAFPYVYPKEYKEIREVFKESHDDRSEGLEKFSRSVKKSLAKEGLTKIKIEYRVKGLYSLYKKYLRHDKDLEKIYDVSAMRILVNTVGECYQVLGVIHSKYRPLPNRIKDYIAFPKPNGYQAIHTTVFVGDGNIVEVQIKTHEMYQSSEYGIAAHLSYKENNQKNEALAWVYALLSKSKTSERASTIQDKEIPKWISELAAYEEPGHQGGAFKEKLVSDFFSERIFAFSPNGDVVDLPKDSTPIDFAYSIHSDVGNHMTGAKINGKLVSLESKLENGDIIEIMIKETAKPNRKWLEIAKTSAARRHIRHELARLEDLKRN